MQIAIRDDQARFLPQAGTRGNAAVAPARAFDDLVRAIGARRAPEDARPVPDDHAERQDRDRRDPIRHDDSRRDDVVRRERPTRDAEPSTRAAEPTERSIPTERAETTEEPAPQAAVQASEAQAPQTPAQEGGATPTAMSQETVDAADQNPAIAAVEAPTGTPVVPAAAPTATHTPDAAADPGKVPASAAAAAPGAQSRPPSAAQNGVAQSGAQQPTDGATPLGHRVADGPKAGPTVDAAAPTPPTAATPARAAPTAQAPSTAAAEPVATQGLASTLLAQTFVSRPASPGTTGSTASGTQSASKALQKGKGKAIGIGQPAPSAHADDQRIVDFKAVTAALLNRAPATDGAPKPTSGETGSANGSTAAASGTPTLGERAAPAAQANSASAPGPAARLATPLFAERIGMTIARAAEAGVDHVSIRLNPRELGRIDVRMEMGLDGRLNLTVSADRQDTLDQLQRNGRDLERALSDAGFQTGAGDLSFSLRDQQAQAKQGDPKASSAEADEEGSPEISADTADDGIIVTHRDGSLMVVDLFV